MNYLSATFMLPNLRQLQPMLLNVQRLIPSLLDSLAVNTCLAVFFTLFSSFSFSSDSQTAFSFFSIVSFDSFAINICLIALSNAFPGGSQLRGKTLRYLSTGIFLDTSINVFPEERLCFEISVSSSYVTRNKKLLFISDWFLNLGLLSFDSSDMFSFSA